MAATGRLVVSIHDVAPSLAREVRYLLDALDAIGARPRVLKVIPNEDGRHDVRADPALVRLLTGEAAAGSEIVLHGYTHRVAGPVRGYGPAALRARLFAGSAAEFMTLDGAQMLERLRAGRQMLRDIGLDPVGFCAPGWLASPPLPRLLARCGFRYALTMAAILDLARRRRLWTPWLGYMGADAVQERLVRLGSDLLAPLTAYAPVIKVFLHPQGAPRSADCTRALREIARLARTRRLVTYERLLAS
jgi:predicted deacetylase